MEQLPPEAAALSTFGKAVFRQLVRGMPEKQIAEVLTSSANTVHRHVKVIYRQFRVNSKPELLSMMLDRQAEQISKLQAELNRRGGGRQTG